MYTKEKGPKQINPKIQSGLPKELGLHRNTQNTRKLGTISDCRLQEYY